jgi:hypothetical protein
MRGHVQCGEIEIEIEIDKPHLKLRWGIRQKHLFRFYILGSISF